MLFGSGNARILSTSWLLVSSSPDFHGYVMVPIRFDSVLHGGCNWSFKRTALAKTRGWNEAVCWFLDFLCRYLWCFHLSSSLQRDGALHSPVANVVNWLFKVQDGDFEGMLEIFAFTYRIGLEWIWGLRRTSRYRSFSIISVWIGLGTWSVLWTEKTPRLFMLERRLWAC